MIFRDIGTHIGDAATLPNGQTQHDFQRLVYHVRETFLTYLVRALDGEHFLPDFHNFFEQPDETRDSIVLENLAGGIRTVARQQDVPSNRVDLAETNTRSSGFLIRYAVKKLCRLHPSRKLKFNVIREIRRGFETWHLEVANVHDEVVESIPIDEETFGVVATARYRKSRWRDGTFVITDSRNRIRFRKSTARIVTRHLG